MQIFSRITGVGSAAPERVVTNEHFASYLDTSDEWIRERTGIEARRWCEPDVSASQLAEPACRQAIESAGLTVEDIDGVVVATVTPDYVFPSTACFLQRRLGIARGLAFDVNAVCAGFVYALTAADGLIRARAATNILVVGVDIYSRIIDPNDRGTCILFGDGAGAVVLSAIDPASATGVSGDIRRVSGLYSAELCADGRYTDILCVPAGTARPTTPESLARGEHFLHMAGREVFKHAVRALDEVTRRVLEAVDLQPADVDHFVSHQANKRILQAMAKQLGVPEDRVPMNVQRYGNTSAASIPLLLAECVHEWRVKEGDIVVLSAVG
ncbi:MAG: ketoacyl-ACP synthase III, partial [Bdellovibrionales bacterium]|nr:ketoacyl-ACP synthase III [Bdellovibrionales bacterium]